MTQRRLAEVLRELGDELRKIDETIVVTERLSGPLKRGRPRKYQSRLLERARRNSRG